MFILYIFVSHIHSSSDFGDFLLFCVVLQVILNFTSKVLSFAMLLRSIAASYILCMYARYSSVRYREELSTSKKRSTMKRNFKMMMMVGKGICFSSLFKGITREGKVSECYSLLSCVSLIKRLMECSE